MAKWSVSASIELFGQKGIVLGSNSEDPFSLKLKENDGLEELTRENFDKLLNTSGSNGASGESGTANAPKARNAAETNGQSLKIPQEIMDLIPPNKVKIEKFNLDLGTDKKFELGINIDLTQIKTINDIVNKFDKFVQFESAAFSIELD